MPAVAEPVRGFSLADFGGPGAPADDAVPTPINTPPPGAPAPTEGTPKEEPAPVEKPEEAAEIPEAPDEPEVTKKDDDDGPSSLTDAFEDPEVTAKKAKAKEAREAKKEEEAAAKPEEPKANERDADLDKPISPHVHEKTRKLITEFQSKAKAARDERDAAIAKHTADLAEAQKEREELRKKAEGTTLPKAVEEELKVLRERVRELDISKDPVIEAKYDKRITANDEGIIAVLKSEGFGQAKGEGDKIIENPKAVADLLKSGLSYETLHPMIEKLKSVGLHVSARKIERLLTQNETLAEEKQREIESWKGDYERRNLERTQQTKQQAEKESSAYRTATDTVLRADVEALAKDFPFLNQPPAPSPSDTPAVAKAKQAAVDEYNAAKGKIEAAVKSFDPATAAPDKQHEAVGRLNASAIQGVIFKQHIIPRVLNDLKVRDARIKELEAKVARYENAGKISKAQTATSGDGVGRSGPEPTSLDEALGRSFG